VFFKWDGNEGHRAIWAVTMIQTLLIFDSTLLISSLSIGRKALFPYSKILGFTAVAVLFILMIINGKIYDGRYNEFAERWRDGPANKKSLKGFLVIILMILPWVALFLISR
jgi:hypothetical protein